MKERRMQEKDEPDKRREAVALRYDTEKDAAPRIIAKGQRLLAEKIIALARQNDIHVQEDPDLVALLAKLDVDTAIPPELYQAVAEVLAFVYRLNQSFPAAKKH
jgi:flagellar biosynthesis protein